MEKMIETLGVIAGIALPLFNIPLILKIIKRKSSQDISLTWVIGVSPKVTGIKYKVPVLSIL